MKTCRAAPFVAMALVLLLVAGPSALAATQPDEVPGDFANGQSNAFGSVTMEPYLRATRSGAVPIVAHLALTDLGVVQKAATILVAFNLKGHDTQLVYDTLSGPDGKAIQPTKTGTAEHGLQLQAFYAPKDLLAVAKGGRIDLTLTGHAMPETNGQWHVGALAIAFDDVWGTLRTTDGHNAELYGFTLLMATGLPPAGLAPFHGMGNGVVAVALLVVCLALAAIGAYTLVSMLRSAQADGAVGTPIPAVIPAAIPVAPAPMVHATVQARAAVPIHGPTIPAAAAAVPVFGSFVSPFRPEPVQGPRLPPGFVVRPWPASAAVRKPAAANRTKSAATAKKSSPRGGRRSQA